MSESNKREVVDRLMAVGIKYEDAVDLRKIAMTLHRWHEMECGIDSGGIERDEKTNKVTWYHAVTGNRYPYPDKETPAIKRLQEIIKRYSDLTYYIQGDPRGAALYILRLKDVPAGENIDAHYSRGIPVYK